MDSLFASLPARQFPPQRRPRPAGPRPVAPARDRFALRYGPSNPSIFTVTLRETLAPVPVLPRRPLCTLEQKDPFGEWRNAHDEAHAATLDALLRLPNDAGPSVAFIRAHRPGGDTQAPEGLRFWRAPIARAHALNALLHRGEMTVAALHRDMGLKHDRLYEYMTRWGVVWQRREGTAQLVDGAGQTYDVRVLSVDYATGTAQVRPDAYLLTLEARYDPRARVYRTPEALELASLLPLTVAATALGLTQHTARAVLPVATLTALHRVPLVRPSDLARTIPEDHWRLSLHEALRGANPCRCAFFDHQTRACGLGRAELPDAGTASCACEDHAHDA